MGAVTRRNPTYQQDRGQPRKHRPDYWLLILTIALLAVGIIVVFSISPALEVEKGVDGNHYVMRQLVAVGLGLAVFTAAALFPFQKLRTFAIPLLILAGIATLVALITPVNADYPAHRWIRVGSFSFQSVELLKVAMILWLAGFLTYRMQNGSMGDFHKTLKPLAIGLVAAGFIVAGLQSDLGSFGVMVAMVGVMSFVAGLPMKRILLIGAIILIGVVIAISSTPYRRDRLAAYLHPEQDCLVSGYQACQALIAVGSGGMIGLGLGRSVQAYGYLPEAENDSIFAIYAEKFGFLGITVLLGLFAAFFTRIKRIAERAPDDYTRLVVVGILVWLSTQAVINIGAMIGLLPLKGITLPLVSYGGSSVLLVMAALGIVFQISRYTSFGIPEASSSPINNGAGRYENSGDRRRVRGSHYPNSGRRT
ncbi:MAG TPA: putative peptidoglycan glycosyltransferase FtsW [Candidatus Saccharimonadales bacterium]|nr:putative peptidoglycan glycosyltransferase FtsW [Candidatus Saccharimonadales bacterium]